MFDPAPAGEVVLALASTSAKGGCRMKKERPELADQVSEEDAGRPLPRDILDEPYLVKQIEEARERIARGETRPGMGSDELIDLLRERRELEARRRSAG
jgi:hypothetical protein